MSYNIIFHHPHKNSEILPNAAVNTENQDNILIQRPINKFISKGRIIRKAKINNNPQFCFVKFEVRHTHDPEKLNFCFSSKNIRI